MTFDVKNLGFYYVPTVSYNHIVKRVGSFYTAPSYNYNFSFTFMLRLSL